MGSASAWTPVADTSAWTPVHEAAPPSATSRFGSGIYSTTLAPIVHLFTTNPVDSVVSMFKGAIGADDLKAIKAAAQHGDYKSAAVLTGHYLTQNPATRAASAMGQDVEKSIKEGDYAGAAGKVLGDAITVGAPIAAESSAVRAAARTVLDPIADVAEAVTDPSVIAKMPGGKAYLEAKEAFDKARKAAQDRRTPPGPVKVLRDANSPAYSQHPTPTPQPAPDATPIPATETLTGRKPGGIANQTPLEQVAPTGPNTATLDGIAQGFKYKNFASAPAGAKPIIENLAKQVDAPKPPAVPSPAVESAAGVSPEVAAPAAEPKTELEDLLERSLNGEKVAEQAKAELNDHLKLEALKKTESIIDKHQTARALKLGKFLQDYGIQPEHIDRMTPEEWQQVGSVAEVENPSATTIQKTKDLLKMGQDQ